MDEPIIEPVAAAEPAATPVATEPVVTPDASHPDSLATPAVPDEEAMWGDLKEDPPAAPDANTPPVIPQEFTAALNISEYVKEPAHMEAAVRTASEVWDVVSGKGSASALLEAMRGQNPQQYEKTILEDIVPYIEKITGKKFGGADPNTPRDPFAELQAKIAEMERRPQLEAQQREEQQFIQRAEAAGGVKLEEFIKGGNGIFDGDVPAAIAGVSAQFTKMGITPQEAMKQVMAGNFSNLEKAYKAAEKAETLKAKAYSDRIRAKFKTLKASVPATKGSSGAINPGSDQPDMETAAGRAKWMAAEFAAGR